MTTIKGKLDAFSETGTEGIIWSVYEDGKTGYDALHCLESGDHLTVLDPEDHSVTLWAGNIDLEYQRNRMSSPGNPQYQQQNINGYWVHGVQVDVMPEEWALWFFNEYPAELIKANIGRLYPAQGSTMISGYGRMGKNDLVVKFRNGSHYKVEGAEDKILEFEKATSKGRYFATEFKNKYVITKLELPNAHVRVASYFPFPTGGPPKEGEVPETYEPFYDEHLGRFLTREEEQEWLDEINDPENDGMNGATT